jgi:uncharacterized protein YcbX
LTAARDRGTCRYLLFNRAVHVAALWRYPVKSLGGEALGQATLTADGVEGDRRVHVSTPHGLVTGRTRHDLLTIPASTAADGAPLVAGHRWDSLEANQLVADAIRVPSRLIEYDGPERFDVLNLLVATDGEVARLGVDVRRLRPNILLGDVAAKVERDWPGKAIAIGDVLIGVHSLRGRCIVTTIDPDSGEQDVEVLRRINREFGGETALNCWVIRAGTIRVGDQAMLVDTQERPERIGGWTAGQPYAV